MRLLVAVLALAACNTVRTPLPGVLDLRSDGAASAPATVPVADAAGRDGIEAWMTGDGASGTAEVTVHDRHLWALRLFRLTDDAKAEIEATTAGGHALRLLQLSEELGPWDALFTACGAVVPCAPVLLPTLSWTLTAARVRPPAEAPAAPSASPSTADERAPPAAGQPP
jgi:nucleoid-associated protein YgaU